MNRLWHIPAALLLTLGAWGTALAHDDAYLDSLTAPHGGQIRMAGAHHLELVLDKTAKGDHPAPVDIYVTDHAGTKQDTTGASGTATLLSAGHKVTVLLKPSGDNRLSGQAPYAASAELKAVVTVTMPGEDAQQARYTPWATHAKHDH